MNLSYLIGDKTKWITHFNNLTLTPNNNTTDADYAYRDISGFDRVDVYIQCSTVFDYLIRTAKDDMTFKKNYTKVENNAVSTGTNTLIVTLRNDDGSLILPDRLNVMIINKSNSETATVNVSYRGYKGVRN